MSRRAATIAVCALLAGSLGTIAASLRVPYIGLAPGSPYNTLGESPANDDGDRRTIEIAGTTVYDDAGHLDFTVVSIVGRCEGGLTLSGAIRTWFDRESAVVPKTVVCPKDASDEEVEQQVQEEMVRSQNSAITVALSHLKIPQRTTVIVLRVAPGSPAAAVLKPKDALLAVDGTAISTLDELRALLARRAVGQTARITYRRNGKEAVATVGTMAAPDDAARPTIGVEADVEVSPPFEISLNTDPVGGPSAGLMLAVGIIELLTPGTLAGDAYVAGTGTISASGEVGPIGGIQQKLVGARDAGAEHFLVPAGNWDKARQSRPDGLTLHRVATLDDALAALAQIKADAD